MSCMALLKRPPSLNFCRLALRVGFLPTAMACSFSEADSTAAQSFWLRWLSMMRLAAYWATPDAGQRSTTSSKRQRASSKSSYW